jgi:hypothetical protein
VLPLIRLDAGAQGAAIGRVLDRERGFAVRRTGRLLHLILSGAFSSCRNGIHGVVAKFLVWVDIGRWVFCVFVVREGAS